MAEPASKSTAQGARLQSVEASTPPNRKAEFSRRIPLNQLYRLPLPLRTFPLPNFYPTNPLSLAHLVYAWLRQIISPPPIEPAIVHKGVWSRETRSVHILDDDSVHALWREGFFGKGSLSRSEATWKARKRRQKEAEKLTALENVTANRRSQRTQFKWDRAREQQLALELQRQQELDSKPQAALESEFAASAKSIHGTSRAALGLPNETSPRSTTPPDSTLDPAAPVGPLELLALPNSALGTQVYRAGYQVNGVTRSETADPSSIFPISLEALSQGLGHRSNGTTRDRPEESRPGIAQELVNGQVLARQPKQQKSVRFSPTITSTTFQNSDPPSPGQTLLNETKELASVMGRGASAEIAARTPSSALIRPDAPRATGGIPAIAATSVVDLDLVSREHFQLSMEEAFFLSFSLGAIAVTDPVTGSTLSHEEIFNLFRRHSSFPPKMTPPLSALGPDDPFLLRYVAYHNYRSLGWCVRDGVKFGVDFLLYLRGPPFSHSEFGLIIVPTQSGQHQASKGKSWHWLHSVTRTLSTVFKSLVLVYIDIPTPRGVEGLAPSEMLRKYRIREVLVRRWSANRNR